MVIFRGKNRTFVRDLHGNNPVSFRSEERVDLLENEQGSSCMGVLHVHIIPGFLLGFPET